MKLKEKLWWGTLILLVVLSFITSLKASASKESFIMALDNTVMSKNQVQHLVRSASTDYLVTIDDSAKATLADYNPKESYRDMYRFSCTYDDDGRLTGLVFTFAVK